MQIANKDGFKMGDTAYVIGNGFGLLCVSYASNGQDALDNAADAGYLDCQLMSDADHAEYAANGWYDSFIYAGNAGEPFWSEYLFWSERLRIKPESEVA